MSEHEILLQYNHCCEVNMHETQAERKEGSKKVEQWLLLKSLEGEMQARSRIPGALNDMDS